MKIRTKLHINACAFVTLAAVMCLNEFEMRGGLDLLRDLLPVVAVP